MLASIPRGDVEGALRAKEAPPELVLGVSRRPGAATDTVLVAWDPDQLAEVLRRAESDPVTLAFDVEELERALAAEVEPHGLRAATAVLAVAVAAGGTAGAASAGQVDGSSPFRVNAADAAVGASDYAVRSPSSEPAPALPAASSSALETAATAAMTAGGAGLLISAAAFATGNRRRARPA